MLYPTAGKSATAGPPGIDCKPQYSITAPPRKAQNSVSTALPIGRFDLHPHSRSSPVIPAPAEIRASPIHTVTPISTAIPAQAGIRAFPIPTAIPHIYRHSGDLPPVIPAKAGIRAFPIPTAIPHIYRHSGDLPPVIPAIYHPSFRRFTTRHSGESRNLAPPLYSTFRPSNGRPPKPPAKSAIFSDATRLPTVHKCGTLAPASPATRPQGSNVTPKAGPAAQYTATRRTANPTRQKASGEKSGNHKKPGSGQHGQTVGIATIVGSGTHSALFHGGVSGHAAGVPTALCRSSNGPGHGKLGHEILQAK